VGYGATGCLARREARSHLHIRKFDETTGCASRPLSLAKIAEFSCATVSAASAALDELACIGVKVEQMDDEFICARLPIKS
jgi:hypothetical protein